MSLEHGPLSAVERLELMIGILSVSVVNWDTLEYSS